MEGSQEVTDQALITLKGSFVSLGPCQEILSELLEAGAWLQFLDVELALEDLCFTDREGLVRHALVGPGALPDAPASDVVVDESFSGFVISINGHSQSPLFY